eukprot:1699887-Amphidinium_carterae.1
MLELRAAYPIPGPQLLRHKEGALCRSAATSPAYGRWALRLHAAHIAERLRNYAYHSGKAKDKVAAQPEPMPPKSELTVSTRKVTLSRSRRTYTLTRTRAEVVKSRRLEYHQPTPTTLVAGSAPWDFEVASASTDVQQK